MNDKIDILVWSNPLINVEALLCLVLPQQATKKKKHETIVQSSYLSGQYLFTCTL